MADPSNYLLILLQIETMLKSSTLVDEQAVYNYQRHLVDWKSMLEAFNSGTAINGWTISRSSVLERLLTNREVVREHTFILRHYRGVVDADSTEHSFNLTVEDVATIFRSDYDINGQCELSGPIQWQTLDYRLFGSILCHYAEGVLKATERLQGGS